MNTLFIDTHNEIINLVLYKDGKVVSKKEQCSSMQHSVITMPLLDELLKENNLEPNDINEILVVNGPGSFTGVRIGVTIAKTYAYLLNIPIKSISTLEEKAIMIDDDNKIVVENEKNGKYIGIFDKNNNLIDNYKYMKNSEYEEFIKTNDVLDPKIDFEKIYKYLNNKDAENVHSVNPLYIKSIEALR